MSTLRIAFQTDDSNRDIAVRAAPAAKEGDFIQVRGEYFQVGRGGFVSKAMRNPPTVYVVQDTSEPKPLRGRTQKAVMLDDTSAWRGTPTPPERIYTQTLSPETFNKLFPLPARPPTVGDRYKPKDPRRPSHAFTVAEVGDDFIRTDRGVTIKIGRLNRYQLVV